jgi:U2 small nuclear ribonucleoprotein A'
MVSRVACLETAWAESFGFSENSGQGALTTTCYTMGENTDDSTVHFTFVRLQERQTAKTLFVTAEKLPTALATTISTTVSTQSSKAAITTDEPRLAVPAGKAGRLMSKEDAEKVKAAIAKATSVEEIRKLERSLREGYMPDMDAVGA